MGDQREEDDEADYSEAISEREEEEKGAKKPKSRAKARTNDETDTELEEERSEVPENIEISGDINLEKIVSQPTWRDILMELVATEKLDPWNIDVVEISEQYIIKIKNMKSMDLRIPANLILAAAIMLRFKSDALQLEEEEQVVASEVFVDESLPPVEIPMLELRTRIPPKRKVTLDELLVAMEKVFDDQKKREEHTQNVDIPAVMNIKLPEFDIDDRMNEVYQRAKKLADKEGLVTFSQLIRERTREEIVFTLLPLLFLVQNGKVKLFQEKIFAEIFIQILPEEKKEGKKEEKENKEKKESKKSEGNEEERAEKEGREPKKGEAKKEEKESPGKGKGG